MTLSEDRKGSLAVLAAGTMWGAIGAFVAELAAAGSTPALTAFFRMGFGFFRCNRNTTLEHSFRCEAISCLYLIRSISMHLNVFPCKETMQLAMVFSPGSCLDHEIGRAFACISVCSKLAENRLGFR